METLGNRSTRKRARQSETANFFTTNRKTTARIFAIRSYLHVKEAMKILHTYMRIIY